MLSALPRSVGSKAENVFPSLTNERGILRPGVQRRGALQAEIENVTEGSFRFPSARRGRLIARSARKRANGSRVL